MSKMIMSDVIKFLKLSEEIDMNISKAIFEERVKQLEKFGIQNHTNLEWLSIAVEEMGEIAKEVCDDTFAIAYIVPYEERLKVEMIQLCAVIISWLNSNYRKELIKTNNRKP